METLPSVPSLFPLTIYHGNYSASSPTRLPHSFGQTLTVPLLAAPGFPYQPLRGTLRLFPAFCKQVAALGVISQRGQVSGRCCWAVCICDFVGRSLKVPPSGPHPFTLRARRPGCVLPHLLQTRELLLPEPLGSPLGAIYGASPPARGSVMPPPPQAPGGASLPQMQNGSLPSRPQTRVAPHCRG